MSSDTFRDTNPITVDFVKGEQPTEEKLDGFAAQVDGGMGLLEKVVGDAWNDYTHTSTLPGYPTYILDTLGGAGGGPWRPTQIASLARLIGPASALNPFRQSRQGYNITIDAGDITYWIPAGANEFTLPTPPLVFSNSLPDPQFEIDTSASGGHIRSALNGLDGSVFSDPKTTKQGIVNAGDYYIDEQGTVFTYSPTTTYSSSLVYYAEMPPYFYDGARMNVMPDPFETETADYIDVAAASGGRQRITLPTIEVLAGFGPGDDGDPYSLPPTGQSERRHFLPPTTFGATLPYALTQHLADGDAIPDGFVQLWQDDGTPGGVIIDGAQFEYHDTNEIDYVGTDLTEGTAGKYRLVTVGTTITESIANLAWRMDTHDHSDRVGGLQVAHSSLSDNMITPSNIYLNWDYTVHAPASKIAGNDHPQYFSRYGWVSALDPGLYDNAILGNVMLAAALADYTSGTYTSDTDPSRILYFGSTNNYIARKYSGDGYVNGMTYVSATKAHHLRGNIAYLGNVASSGSVDYETEEIRLNYSSSNYGSIFWDHTNRFAFAENGNVQDTCVQAGEFLVHNSNSHLDPTSPGTAYGLLNVNASGYPELYLSDAYVGVSGYISLNGAAGLHIVGLTSTPISIEAEEDIAITSSAGDMAITGTTSTSIHSDVGAIHIHAYAGYSTDSYIELNPGTGTGGNVVVNGNYLRLPRTNGTPGTAAEAGLYYNEADDHLYYYNGSTTWVKICTYDERNS